MKPRLLAAVLVLLVLVGSVGWADGQQADGAAPAQSSPLDAPLTLRRQTLIVRDVEASLALYRDAIGMEVIYDQEIRRPHATEDREERLRLVFLKASHARIGVLGLLEYEYGNPGHPSHGTPVRREGFTPGHSILVFNTAELDEKWARVVATPGVEVISPPELARYPSYDGTGVIRVNVTTFYDPDGFLVELNQLFDPLD